MDIRDYYAFLELEHGATDEEIKRAYVKKRREFADDKDKLLMLHEAYEVLKNPELREKSDENLIFGERIRKINEQLAKCITIEQKNYFLLEARKIYLEMLDANNSSVQALTCLIEIEEELGDVKKVIQYLQCLINCVEGKQKIVSLRKLGYIYQNNNRIDDAIKCFYNIYKIDVSNEEDIKNLARLYYCDKNDLRKTIQLLSDCIEKTQVIRTKILYIYEIIHAIRNNEDKHYQQLEECLYRKLLSFKSKNIKGNLVSAATISLCVYESLKREDVECAGRLISIYKEFDIKHDELNKTIENAKKITSIMLSKKIHKAVILCMCGVDKSEEREFGLYILRDAYMIEESIKYVKEKEGKFWNSDKDFLEFENEVKQYRSLSLEYRNFVTNKNISFYMKKVLETFLLSNIFNEEEHFEELNRMCNILFCEEDKKVVKDSIKEMNNLYPICYSIFASRFLYDKNFDVTDGIQNKISNEGVKYPNAKEGYENKKYWFGFGMLLVSLILFPKLALITIPIFVVQFYHRHKKRIDSIPGFLIVKWIIIIFMIMLISEFLEDIGIL